ncbi:hypothetical protein TI05_11390 [Achromatium sp. WMS3]|nr:hypothetical protein TI05_11390 [Achromatium sp. WMS3]
MAQLQLIFFFVTGFLVSRVVVKTHLPQKLVYLLMGRSHNSISITVLYLIGTAAIMSLFIPNAITMLTLLPVLDLLSKSFQKDQSSQIPTMLTLAVLYGANIGGMGTITGTPTNLALVAYLGAYNIPNSAGITFFNWMLWGIPLVILLALLSWLLLCLGFKAWYSNANQQIYMPYVPNETEHFIQSYAWGIIIFYIVSAGLLSFLLSMLPDYGLVILVLTGLITISFTWLLFWYPVTGGQPILELKDTYSNLPKKGLELLGIVLILGGILYFLDLQIWFANQLSNFIPHNISPFGFVLTIALITTFSTELLSNTLVQLAMFLIILPLAQNIGLPPIQVLLVVTLSCTCAFMSPIATPVNALAFGGTQNMSLMRFMGIGAIMNILGSVFITFYVLNFVQIG